MRLLRNRPTPTTLRIISTQAQLPEGWLLSILHKPDMSPSVDRIEKLYEYLSGKQLQV